MKIRNALALVAFLALAIPAACLLAKAYVALQSLQGI